jgi:hypothetical protein
MEFVSAHWDPHGKRFVAGAQDNSVMITVANASATAAAVGLMDGDGTVTAVDANVAPSRLWGAVENMGNGRSDDPGSGDENSFVARPEGSTDADERADNNACETNGFGFWQDGHPEWSKGGLFCPDLLKWFSGGQFQQFVSPWALLSNDPTQVIIAEKQPGILASRCVLYFAAGVHVCFEGP